MIKDSWLREYGRYTTNQESPEAFHLWVGLTLLATILNREVWFDQNYFIVWPNQYVVLVAGSQQCRKSTAIKIGEEILKSLPLEKSQKPNLLGQKTTPEALIDSFWLPIIQNETGIVKAKSGGLVIAPELSVFLDRQARVNGLLAIIVDLYDSPDYWEYRTITRGTKELFNVYANLLSGSSPEYLRLSLPYDEIGGGILARTIFVYQFRPGKRIPFPVFGDKERRSRDELIHDLLEIRKLRGQVRLTPGATTWYENWYRNLDIDDVEPTLKPYYSKKESHVIKVATLLSVAENDNLLIDELHLKMALKILEDNEKLLANVMGTLITAPTAMAGQTVLQTIYDIAASGKEITRSRVLKKVVHFMNAEELTKAIQTLAEAGILRINFAKGGEYYELIRNNDS